MHRLDLFCTDILEPDDSSSPEIVQLEMVPKILEFHTSESSKLTTKLLYAKGQDGRPAFNFMDLRRLSMSFARDDEPNVRYLLRNAELLEELRLSLRPGQSLTQLHDVLSLRAPTLKVLDLEVALIDYYVGVLLAGLCEELEAKAGHNTLEALSFEVRVEDHIEREYIIGLIIQKVEKVLVKPGWSALRQVSLKVSILCCPVSAEVSEVLQSLPDIYLSHLSKLESVAFNYSAYGKCKLNI